jgi:uncharacterized protein YndB with AHSA1/START domain
VLEADVTEHPEPSRRPMIATSVLHSNFSVERSYRATPARVFAAWADPTAKRRWGACHAEHYLDFCVGGREFVRGGEPGGPVFTTDIVYHDILPDRRIIYTYALQRDGRRTAVALVTVEFEEEEGSNTRLTVTEQGAYLDIDRVPSELEEGTREALDRLDEELRGWG